MITHSAIFSITLLLALAPTVIVEEPLMLELMLDSPVARQCRPFPVKLQLRNSSSVRMAIIWTGTNSRPKVSLPKVEWSVIEEDDLSTHHAPGHEPGFLGKFCKLDYRCWSGYQEQAERIVILDPSETTPTDFPHWGRGTYSKTTDCYLFADRLGLVHVVAYFTVSYMPAERLVLDSDGKIKNTDQLIKQTFTSNEVSLHVRQ